MGLHPQNPLDRGSEDEIWGKLSSAEITKRAEKDKDLISTKGDSEEREAINPNCILESQEIDMFCPLDREGTCRRNGKSKASFVGGGSNLEGKNFELPEFHNVLKESRLKKKRFGSLNEILEKGLSEADKRKRVRDEKLETIKTLEVGKKVGIEFIGDENEVVKDLISLAEKEILFSVAGSALTKPIEELVFHFGSVRKLCCAVGGLIKKPRDSLEVSMVVVMVVSCVCLKAALEGDFSLQDLDEDEQSLFGEHFQKHGLFSLKIPKVILTWDGVSPRSYWGRLHWDSILRGDIFFAYVAD
ncbi:hypothetical protein V6N11_044046 [Hibiscus sabdariffa]|uniref:Uncharacterized protein n=1 Tax=Hibiscus sabdariffa TaxID=183260 RepID=A0ABR2RE76_9ROSI